MMMMAPSRRSSLVLLASAALLLCINVASARYLKEDSSDGADSMWVSLGAVSCMDDSGENLDTHRDVDSLMDCQKKCTEMEGCNAVTYNSDGLDCYLKEKCQDREERDNGDVSAVKASADNDHNDDDDGDDGDDDDDDDDKISSEESESSESSEDDHISDKWESLGDVSCMDNGGNNEETHRDVDSLKECERKCGDRDNCNAVTYNSESKNCYLKMTCYDQEKRDNGDESAQLKDIKFCWGKNGNDPKVFGVTHSDDNVCCVASPPGGRSWECCKEDYGCDGTCYNLMTEDGFQKGEPAC